MKKELKYYQPELNGEFPPNFCSFEVFKDKESIIFLYPNYEIKEYQGNDIEEPSFLDICSECGLEMEPCDHGEDSIGKELYCIACTGESPK